MISYNSLTLCAIVCLTRTLDKLQLLSFFCLFVFLLLTYSHVRLLFPLLLFFPFLNLGWKKNLIPPPLVSPSLLQNYYECFPRTIDSLSFWEFFYAFCSESAFLLHGLASEEAFYGIMRNKMWDRFSSEEGLNSLLLHWELHHRYPLFPWIRL